MHRPDTAVRKHYEPRREVELALHPKLLYAGVLERTANFNESLHTHPFVEVIFVNSGKGQVRLDKEIRETAAGNIIITNANVPHGETSSVDDPLSLTFFGARNFNISGLPQNCLIDGDYAVLASGEEEKRISFLFQNLVEETKTPGRFSLEMAEAVLRIIVVLVMRLVSAGKDLPPYVNGVYTAAKLYIENNAASLATVEDLCDKLNVTHFYLSHLFSRYGDKQPLQCLSKRKVEIAKKFLIETQLSVPQIAEKSGFTSAPNFFRVFKQYAKTSPAQYRLEGRKRRLSLGLSPYKEQTGTQEQALSAEIETRQAFLPPEFSRGEGGAALHGILSKRGNMFQVPQYLPSPEYNTLG